MVHRRNEKKYLKSYKGYFENVVCRLGLICHCHLFDNLVTRQIFMMINVKKYTYEGLG